MPRRATSSMVLLSSALALASSLCHCLYSATHPTVVPVPRMLAEVMGFLQRQPQGAHSS